MKNKAEQIIQSRESDTHLVSVYGTLKETWGNHRLLERTPIIKGHIGISKLGGRGFPIIKLGNDYRLNVEVYEVNASDLGSLDSLEGYREGQTPTFYDRKRTDVTLNDGSKLNTFVYEYVSDLSNEIDSECEHVNGVFNWLGSRKG